VPAPRWLLVSVGVGLVLACACASPSNEEGPATARFGIVDGEASGSDQDQVLLLRAVVEGREQLCTATLVAPNLVLTARHCVSYLTDGLFRCSPEGEAIDNPDGGGTLGLHFPAEDLAFFGRATPRRQPLARGERVLSTLSPSICRDDLAFVVLDQAIELPIAPLRLGRPAEVGERAILVGYGMDAAEAAIDYVRQPRRQKRDLTVAELGPDSLADGVDELPPRTLIMNGPSGCIGDSGGPLLAESSGAVLGVYSVQEGAMCSSPEVRHHLVHVPPFRSLIQQAFEAARAEPLKEPEAEPGTAGTGGMPSDPEPETAGHPEAGAGSAGEPPLVRPRAKTSSCALAYEPDTRGSALLLLGLLLARRRRA
jgi:hypothetical protein